MKKLLLLGIFLNLLIPFRSYCQLFGLSGNPGTLTINAATAGLQPNTVTDTSTTYSLTTILGGSSINGKINSNMPANVTLKVALGAPPGSTSFGLVTMTTTASNLITSLPIIALLYSNSVTYSLSATAAAAPVTAATKTLTITVQ